MSDQQNATTNARPQERLPIVDENATVYLKCHDGIVKVTGKQYSEGVQRMLRWIR